MISDATALSRMLPDAWPVFFHRRAPRPLQAAAMPVIVCGTSALLCAPTASGKTEAAVAPLYQRHVSFRRRRLSVLYVAPTKALVNDVFLRLTTALSAGGGPRQVARYTGDHHDFGDPGGLFALVTTPEALDSLQLMHPETLSGVRAVVIDEIHFLHGQPRGQQLRHVLQRIEVAATKPGDVRDRFQRVGISATIDNLDAVRQTWIGDGEVLTSGDARMMEPLEIATELGHEGEAIAAWIAAQAPHKLLVFCSRRNDAHALAVELSRRLAQERWTVFLHMGPLAASERDRVEREYRSARHAVCVATSTLEVGIDIGDVEAVALVGPPTTATGFLQRVGRAGRRDAASSILTISRDDEELTRFRALLCMARAGELDQVHEYDRPSVRFQQILSLAWRATRSDRRFGPKVILQETGDPSHLPVLEDMIASGALQNRGGALVPADELMDLGDQRRIHTVIVAPPSANVTNAVTGDRIAQAPAGTTPGVVFLGGVLHGLASDHHGGFVSAPATTLDGPLAKFGASGGGHGSSQRLMASIAILEGADPTVWLADGPLLTTWGGSDNNRLLSWLLAHRYGAPKLVWSERAVRTGTITPSLAEILREANRINPSLAFDDAFARAFAQTTSFSKYLGPLLRRQEAVAAIPWADFLEWLASVRLIKAVQTSGTTGTRQP